MRIVKPGSPAPDIGDFEITEIRYIGEEGHKVIIPRVEVSLYRSYARYRRLKAIYVTAIKGQLHQGHLELLKELINEEAAMVALINDDIAKQLGKHWDGEPFYHAPEEL